MSLKRSHFKFDSSDDENNQATTKSSLANYDKKKNSLPPKLLKGQSTRNSRQAPLESKQNKQSAKAKSLLPFRKSLPIYSARNEIIDQIRSNDSIIIVGETGSGKSTQIPQYILEDLASIGAIAVTQPRRVAAISLAKRVAEEVGTKLGSKVGYTIRFDDTTSSDTLIKYLTDGMLLREILLDPLLQRYGAVILDEAHERTLRTDILFGMVKEIQRARKELVQKNEKNASELKIIVMSATLDAERFSEYFNNAKILYVSGRLYPVRVFNTVEPQSDYLDSALINIFQIHLSESSGDILVFLTGQEEIETLDKLIKEYAEKFPETQSTQLLPCPIFAALPTAQQQRVFTPAPPNTRKVILATNIAETSITIPGIRYVIDCGVEKRRSYNSRIGMESLLIQPISKASARQRMGRAGREAPGVCYRLYTEEDFEKLEENTVPEIRRCNLTFAVLLLKASGTDDILKFDFMDRPSREALIRALEQLYALGGISDDGRLTDIGRKMAEFPLDPPFSKVLLISKELNCTAEVVAIISLLSVDTIFYTPHDKRDEALVLRRKFMRAEGDHLTLLNVLRSYTEMHGDAEWCRENFINMRNMKHVLDVKKQLEQFCRRLDIDPRMSCGSEYETVLKCFLAGFFQNTALLQHDGTYKTVVGNQIVNIHPTSVMFGKKIEAIMFNELVFTTKQYVRGVSAIQAHWLLGAAPRYFNNASSLGAAPVGK
ncbi:uncharacterized protein VTP21DRAFT_11374 [Calcarisporiella thermophila]|uniref:uncharacterized protein n=1 Tax=Calcarisporiella thermophila TaxID=911321 RepID=UPI0037435B97